jgi:hypothetical protein
VSGWENGLPVFGGSDIYSSDGPGLPPGWRLLISADLEHEAYQFAEVRVWMDPLGALYGAADSGCSCPTPFSGLTADECKPDRDEQGGSEGEGP